MRHWAHQIDRRKFHRRQWCYEEQQTKPETKSAEIQQKQHEQSRQIYRACDVVDEATNFANDVERGFEPRHLNYKKNHNRKANNEIRRPSKNINETLNDTKKTFCVAMGNDKILKNEI